MFTCAKPGCQALGKSSCSGCGREQYCSSSCQKLDWKEHKSMCPILKKLSSKLQPFNEAYQIVSDICASSKGNNLRILQHLLSYAEFQFGKQIEGIGYRVRSNGDGISNWEVEMNVFYDINRRLILCLRRDESLSDVMCDDMELPYLQRQLNLLNPWLINLDSDRLSNDQSNHILRNLYFAEQNMATVMLFRGQYDMTEGHCQRCLAYSRRFRIEGDEKTTHTFKALKIYCDLRERQGDHLNAVVFAEEAYNLVVQAYDPAHLQVQEAAGILIAILTVIGDFFNAQRYAQVTYSNLRDKKNGIDQESEAVAKGAYNLSNVTFQQDDGDLVKAEELARESTRIRTLIFHSLHSNIG
jgi:hypothetical protein